MNYCTITMAEMTSHIELSVICDSKLTTVAILLFDVMWYL